MEKNSNPIIFIINVKADPVTVMWVTIFNWYFLAMDLVFAGVQMYFIVALVNFYVVFGVIYTILWLTIPFYNAMF